MAKAGLSHDLVVRTAAEVADEVGWERLTLALVAQRLSVSLPALYKHISSLEGLRRDLALLSLTELERELRTAIVGTSGDVGVQALANAYRSFAQHHPGLYAATLKDPNRADAQHLAASRAVLRVAYTTLEGYHLVGRDATDAVRAVRAVLHGFVSLESTGGFGPAQDVDRSYGRLVAGLETVLAHWSDGARSPHMHASLGQASPELVNDQASPETRP